MQLICCESASAMNEEDTFSSHYMKCEKSLRDHVVDDSVPFYHVFLSAKTKFFSVRRLKALDLNKTSLSDFKLKNHDVIFKFIGRQRSIQSIRVDHGSIIREMLEYFRIKHCLSMLTVKREVDS